MFKRAGFTRIHLITRFQDVDIIDDFNSTFVGDTKSLKRRSILCRNDNRQRDNGISTYFFLQKLVSDFPKNF
nr:unnamed protein product [Callosobruchus analis]